VGKVAHFNIPTPDAVASDIKYDRLYPAQFAQPATYIRFSSTVEDCIGVPYCMSAEDEDFLKSMNHRRPKSAQRCSEDWFEQAMYSFEETSQIRQPFAAVDKPPVLLYKEMEVAFDETVEESARMFASDIYEYWKSQRLKGGNNSLMARLKTLKMDTGQEADDSDPYACFRRREVRQVRKTRGRDAQIMEKLKKLRRELEDGRQLLDLVKRREKGRKEDLTLSRQIFQQRAAVREMKRTLNIEESHDELLITQKTPKKSRIPDMAQHVAPLANQSRFTNRPETALAPESNLINLRDVVARKAHEIENLMKKLLSKFEEENLHYVDKTMAAVLRLYSPDLELNGDPGFVSMKASYMQQPTPPESVVDEALHESDVSAAEDKSAVSIRWASPVEQKSFKHQPRYRRRVGRAAVMIDRHNCKSMQPERTTPRMQDLGQYDYDDGDDDIVDVEEAIDVTGHWGEYSFDLQARWAIDRGDAQRRSSINSRDSVMSGGCSLTGALNRI